ncbi:MAG: pyruvate, phosphate dikinase, partial [Paracoccus sp. (in: a-proteobacteria)]
MDMRDITETTQITPSAGVTRDRHGWRAKCLQRLVRMDLPVPLSFALPCETVSAIAAGRHLRLDALRHVFEAGSGLVSVRPSAVMPEWGGPGTVLNVGINDALHARLCDGIGRAGADAIYLSFVHSYAINIARLDPDMFAQ